MSPTPVSLPVWCRRLNNHPDTSSDYNRNGQYSQHTCSCPISRRNGGLRCRWGSVCVASSVGITDRGTTSIDRLGRDRRVDLCRADDTQCLHLESQVSIRISLSTSFSHLIPAAQHRSCHPRLHTIDVHRHARWCLLYTVVRQLQRLQSASP